MKYTFIIFISLFFYSKTFGQHITMPNSSPAKVFNFTFLDSTLLRVHYKMLSVKDTAKPKELTENAMLLQIGKNITKFSDYHMLLSDSLWNVLVSKKVSRNEAFNKTLPMSRGAMRTIILKNYPKGKITTIDRIPFNTYRYVEESFSPAWNLEEDVEIICGYKCKKANTRLFGREYTVWYAPEIPISDGPWKLGGLPGLILKAYDKQKHYIFECTGIIKNNWGDVIDLIDLTLLDIKKEQFFKLQKRYFENPGGTIENTGMIQSELPASARKSRPYNPIELSD